MITQNLNIEYILQNQSFVEISLNEAFETIDAFAFHIAKNFTITLPENPAIGDIYIINDEASQDYKKIAVYLQNRGWYTISPKDGMGLYLTDIQKKYRFTNNEWTEEIANTSQTSIQANWNETDYQNPSFIQNKPYLHSVASSGNYNDLINKPYLHSVANSGDYNDLINKPYLHSVANSGDYNDLTNKPYLHSVANSGDYNDLINKPSNAGGTQYMIGDIKHSVQNIDHNSWLLCDGREISRSQYTLLFALIGTMFGIGDGTTTFQLPDARGRVLGTIGQGFSLTNRTVGNVVGAENHTLAVNEIPSHTHAHSSNAYNQNFTITPSSSAYSFASNKGGVVNTAPVTGTTGGGQAHNNMQPTIFIGNTFIYSGQ